MKESPKFKIFITISIIFALIISWHNFTAAQVPSVPDPVNSDNICFDKIGGTDINPILKQVPCKSSVDKLTPQKNTSFPIENIKKNANKIFNELLKAYGDLAALFNKWVEIENLRAISDFFGGLNRKLQDFFW